jgi:hypothetical protein
MINVTPGRDYNDKKGPPRRHALPHCSWTIGRPTRDDATCTHAGRAAAFDACPIANHDGFFTQRSRGLWRG